MHDKHFWSMFERLVLAGTQLDKGLAQDFVHDVLNYVCVNEGAGKYTHEVIKLRASIG